MIWRIHAWLATNDRGWHMLNAVGIPAIIVLAMLVWAGTGAY